MPLPRECPESSGDFGQPRGILIPYQPSAGEWAATGHRSFIPSTAMLMAELSLRHPLCDRPRTVTDPGAPPAVPTRYGGPFLRYLRVGSHLQT
jgi:hypothetical protein